MRIAESILSNVGEGPVTVTLRDGSEYDIHLQTVEEVVTGFEARGTGQHDDDVEFRIENPPHADDGLRLDRRGHPADGWETLGHVDYASADGT